MPLELIDEFQRLIDRAITRGQGGPAEFELLRKDGNYIPVNVLARRLEQREGIHVLLGVENISETRRLQSQLLHAQKMDAIGKLASSIAHDFNNILTVIMSYAGVLKLKFGEAESAIDFIDHIEQAAEHAASLTGQLLTFSRQELIHKQQIDPGNIILESEQLLRQLIEENIELKVVIEKKTPHIRCDAAQLLQLIMNMVINARDALHGSGGRIELRCAPCKKSTQETAACITISDNGPGIDSDIRAKIFDPFFTTKKHGTGLGLATVRDIVFNMGGSINLESSSSRGASFSIIIPAVPEPEQKESSALALENKPVEGCVVIVDDDPMVREATIHTLEHAGIDVLAASNAKQALTLLEELGERAAILVTDVVMPGMGGRELAEKALELYPTLPVLYITGYTDDAILRHGIETETVNLLRKPYSPQIFINVTKRIIARNANRQHAK